MRVVAACLGLIGTVCRTERALASCRCHCRFGGCQQLSIVGILRRKGRRLPCLANCLCMVAAAVSLVGGIGCCERALAFAGTQGGLRGLQQSAILCIVGREGGRLPRPTHRLQVVATAV